MSLTLEQVGGMLQQLQQQQQAMEQNCAADRAALEEEMKGRRNDQAIIDKAVKDIRDNIEREEGGLEWLHSALAKGDQVFQKFKDDEFKGTQEKGEKVDKEVEGMKAKMDKADGIFEIHKEGMKKKEGMTKGELEAIKKKMEEV